jgi:hypothetical protein
MPQKGQEEAAVNPTVPSAPRIARITGFSVSLFGILCVVLPARAQRRPLQTDDASLVAVGHVRAELGVEFLQGQRYSLSGLKGDLTRLGVLSMHAGVGEYAEFQLSGVVRNFLSVTQRTPPVIPPDFEGNATSDFGDLVLGAKLKLLPESPRRPALAFKFSVQLPNASNESGLGKDETEFYGTLIFAKSLGRAQILGNLGLAILGSPVVPNTQADKLVYGFAGIVPLYSRLNLVAEVYGLQGPQRTGNEDSGQARVGLQFLSGSLRWDAAAIAGLRHDDADSGLALGVTYEFQAFGRTRAPKTIR